MKKSFLDKIMHEYCYEKNELDDTIDFLEYMLGHYRYVKFKENTKK